MSKTDFTHNKNKINDTRHLKPSNVKNANENISAVQNKALSKSASKKELLRKSKAECDIISASTSHTQFFKQSKFSKDFERVTSDEFFSISGQSSADSFDCGSKEKIYTERELLKKRLKKEFDPIPNDSRWTNECAPAFGWDIAKVLAFIVQDPTSEGQKDRIDAHVKDLCKISCTGYSIGYLNEIGVIISYLVESLQKNPQREELLNTLLKNIKKPVFMDHAFDIVKYYDGFKNYIGFLGYLLMRLESDSMFELVSSALFWHLSEPDTKRSQNSVRLSHTLAAAAPVLQETVAKMLAVSSSHRFPTFLNLGLILACDNEDTCVELLKHNVLENIFYRFNPYFPNRMLPAHDINPADPQDINVKLGDSSIHMSPTMSLLQVLLKTALEEHQKHVKCSLPCPDEYAQRCFLWAYRYECRARGHQHQRKVMTVVASVLVHCFGSKLKLFSEMLMPDILSLCVKTEVPPRDDWTGSVYFSKSQDDVQFKKLLIYFSVTLLKKFPHNRTMVESRLYLLGLMYLLDPELSRLRTKWAPPLFAELRTTSLQALVCIVPQITPQLIHDYGIIRRMMWYIEWYSESPYELSTLYWCLRLLQVAIFKRRDVSRQKSMKNLFDTHGVIIIVRMLNLLVEEYPHLKLCYTLLKLKTPPVEKSQAVICLCLRLLTSAVEMNEKASCVVYPNIKWPSSINTLANTMMDVIIYSLERHLIISDRWLIALLNFVWEAIIWNPEYRKKFITNDGIYKLLDIITMTRPSVQCIALAVVCDVTRAGDAVGQLVTWRAQLGADDAYPRLVKRGSTIATLLASIFRDECLTTGVQLEQNGVIKDLKTPIMSPQIREKLQKLEYSLSCPSTPLCLPASELAGSRLSKAYALFSMLSADMENKVSIADETYNLYKNIQLKVEDEVVLVLCAHYLTLKLSEVWIETKLNSPGYLPQDEDILDEFLKIGTGWALEIKRQQEEVIKKSVQKNVDEENSLYEFMARVRLNISLDALEEVRCIARSSDRAFMTHALLQEAVRAHHRRSEAVRGLRDSVIRTHVTTLDVKNTTGQNIMVQSIRPKEKLKPILDLTSS